MATSLRTGLLSATAVLAFAAGACSTESQSATGSTPVESAADQSAFLDITLATSDGGQLDLGTLEGQDVVLWFWAPW